MKVLIANRFFGGGQIPTGRMARDAAQELVRLGHEVTALTSAGQYEGAGAQAARDEKIRVERLWTPGGIPRAAAWLLFTLQAGMRIPRMDWDVCILMTDPPLLPWLVRCIRNKVGAKRKIVAWLMDLYPEALAASGRMNERGVFYRTFLGSRQRSLAAADLLVCLGEAQKERLGELAGKVKCVVVPPWDRREGVGRAEDGKLQNVALYAGNLGEAHGYRQILEAARHLPGEWTVRFSVRGAKERALRKESWKMSNVRVTEYASEEETPAMLASARVHLITMSPGWEGVVVPSKLYGCVRTGRPVLFLGPEQSDTAREIRKHGWGEVLPPDAGAEDVARAIVRLGGVATKDWKIEDGAKTFAAAVASKSLS
ncbi:MAG: glycosyltransferase family 4 protein [Solirubrobacterales bacterium]